MSTHTVVTVEQFAQMPREEAARFELVEGELVPVPSGTPRHSGARDKLLIRLSEFLQHNPLGVVLAETECRTGPSTVRRPDLSFFSLENWRSIDPDVIPVPHAPELAIEILSPSETVITVHRKITEYLASGGREVWLLDVTNQEIHICGGQTIRRLRAGDMLESALLPGFSAPVTEVVTAFPG